MTESEKAKRAGDLAVEGLIKGRSKELRYQLEVKEPQEISTELKILTRNRIRKKYKWKAVARSDNIIFLVSYLENKNYRIVNLVTGEIYQ